MEHIAQRGDGVSVLGSTQNLTGYDPGQPALSKGVCIDDLHRCLPISTILCDSIQWGEKHHLSSFPYLFLPSRWFQAQVLECKQHVLQTSLCCSWLFHLLLLLGCSIIKWRWERREEKMKGMWIQFLSKGICGSHFSMSWANVVKTQTVEVNIVLKKKKKSALQHLIVLVQLTKEAPEHDREIFLFRK